MQVSFLHLCYSYFRNIQPKQCTFPLQYYTVSHSSYNVHTHITSHSVLTSHWYNFINKFLMYRSGISPTRCGLNNLHILKCQYIYIHTCTNIQWKIQKKHIICSYIRHINYSPATIHRHIRDSVFSGIAFPVHFGNSKILKTLFPDHKKFIIPFSITHRLSHIEKQTKVLSTND
jgi:hypothetical protein